MSTQSCVSPWTDLRPLLAQLCVSLVGLANLLHRLRTEGEGLHRFCQEGVNRLEGGGGRRREREQEWEGHLIATM